MSELDPRLSDALAELRAEPPVRAEARARLSAAIARQRTELAPQRGTGRERRALVLSPLRAVLVAALLVLATSVAWSTAWRLGAAVETGGGAAPVQFVLVARDARSVSLVGDFNDWDPRATPLTPGAGGVWSVVLPLSRGRFGYSFLIDDREWRADPLAPPQADDFGRPSSVVYVSGPETAP